MPVHILLHFADVDECSASISVCDVNANCKNTRGSYRCFCNPGFTGNGKTCTGKRIRNNTVFFVIFGWYSG